MSEERNGGFVSGDTRQLAEKFAAFGPAYMRWVGLQMRAVGVTYPRMRLIGALRMSEGPQIMSDLGHQLGVTPRNVTKLVDALEEEGLVRRRPHPTDRRATVVELTEKGAGTAAGVFEEHLAAVGTLFEGLGEDDRRELLRILDLLEAELRRKGIQPGRYTEEAEPSQP